MDGWRRRLSGSLAIGAVIVLVFVAIWSLNAMSLPVDMVDAIAVVLALFALAVAIFSLRAANRSNDLSVTIDLFRDFRNLADSRREDLPKLKDYSPDGGFRDLPPDLRKKVLKHSHFYDNLGVLVAHRLVDQDTVAGFLGDSALAAWETLSPFIMRERELWNDQYQIYFGDLVARFKETPPKEVRAKYLRVPDA